MFITSRVSFFTLLVNWNCIYIPFPRKIARSYNLSKKV